jgi:hypothetical protein
MTVTPPQRPQDTRTQGAPVRTLRNERGNFICGAMTQQGTYCQRAHLEPNGRCLIHGGAGNPPGPTHHRWQGKGYSQVLTGDARERYLDLLNDAESLLSPLHEIAILDVQLEEIVRRLHSTRDGHDLYQELLTSLQELQRLISAALPPASPTAQPITALLQRLLATATAAASEKPLQDQMVTLMEARRRQAESEMERRVRSRQVMQLNEAEAQAMMVIQIIKEEVTDRDTRHRIGTRIAALRGVRARDAIEASASASTSPDSRPPGLASDLPIVPDVLTVAFEPPTEPSAPGAPAQPGLVARPTPPPQEATS